MFGGAQREVPRSLARHRVNFEAYGPHWLQTDGGDITPGRNFTEQENTAAAPVVILNDTLPKQLFGRLRPDREGQCCWTTSSFRSSASTRRQPASSSRSTAAGRTVPKAIFPIETARRHLGRILRWMLITVKPRDDVMHATR